MYCQKTWQSSAFRIAKIMNFLSVWDNEEDEIFPSTLQRLLGMLQSFQCAVKGKTQTKHNHFCFPLNNIGEFTFQELTVDVRYSVINDLIILYMYYGCLWLCY